MCVATDIMHGAANNLHGAAVISHAMDSILSNVPDILHVQHQYFEIFLSVLEFSKGIFYKSAQKMVKLPKKWLSLFRGAGSEPKVINITFFCFLNPSLTEFKIKFM